MHHICVSAITRRVIDESIFDALMKSWTEIAAKQKHKDCLVYFIGKSITAVASLCYIATISLITALGKLTSLHGYKEETGSGAGWLSVCLLHTRCSKTLQVVLELAREKRGSWVRILQFAELYLWCLSSAYLSLQKRSYNATLCRPEGHTQQCSSTFIKHEHNWEHISVTRFLLTLRHHEQGNII